MKNHVLQIITFANDEKTRTNSERRELKAEAGLIRCDDRVWNETRRNFEISTGDRFIRQICYLKRTRINRSTNERYDSGIANFTLTFYTIFAWASHISAYGSAVKSETLRKFNGASASATEKTNETRRTSRDLEILQPEGLFAMCTVLQLRIRSLCR